MHWFLRLPYAAWLGAALICLLSSSLVVEVLSVHLRDGAEKEAAKFIDRIAATDLQRRNFLADMAKLPALGCDEDSLETLRFGLYSYYFMNDAVIFKPGTNQIQCSSMMGAFEHPVILNDAQKKFTGEPDTELWINPSQVPQWSGALTFIFRKGDVGVVFYEKAEKGLDSDFGFAGFQVAPDGRWTLLSGNPKILADYKAHGQSLFERPLYGYRCMEPPANACFLMRWKKEAVLRSERSSLFGGALACLTLSVSAFGFLRRQARQDRMIARRVKRAIVNEGRGISCHYQPFISTCDGRVVGCEVLARFKDDYGTLVPSEFVPEVERLGLTWEFTEQILMMALRDLGPLTDTRGNFRVSVNFFPRDLVDGQMERVERSLPLRLAVENNVRLCFEILETGVQSWEDMGRFREFVERNSFEVAVDDFGTGFSNIAQVRRSSVDLIKIDRSFVRDLGFGETALKASLIGPILDIAQSVGAKVVAEGVETADQRSILNDVGVHYLQGYHFSRPLPIEEFLDYVWMNTRMDAATVIPFSASNA